MKKNKQGSYLVAISGNIACGKSRASKYLARCFDIPLLSLDEICRQLLQPGFSGFRAIKKTFGSRFITQNNQLDRQALRKALFSEHQTRKHLDFILHPLAYRTLQELILKLKSDYILVEVPLLFEANWENAFNKTVLVYADKCTCCKRLISRDNISLSDATCAISSQMSIEKKVMLADHVINNNSSWAVTINDITHLGRLLFFNKEEIENS